MQRADLRRAAGMLRAIQSALSGEVGKDIFEALSEDSAEAEAEYNRHRAATASGFNGTPPGGWS